MPLIENNQNSIIVTESYLVHFSQASRLSLLTIFVILTIFSLIGNTAAIIFIIRKNYRCIQKTCIISLAISDILSTLSIGMINISDLSEKILIWHFDDFFCPGGPILQMVGILASVLALVFIALDRYRNVVQALNNRWDPSLCFCLLGVGLMWFFTLLVSYPVGNFYSLMPLKVIVEEKLVDAWLCLTFHRQSLNKYFITMSVVIFLPILVIFVWCYYHIACLVWKHRKPLSTRFRKKSKPNNSEAVESEARSSQPTAKQDVRVEKKIRTFKIILSLMIVFIVCRLPYYLHMIIKFYYKPSVTPTDGWNWILEYAIRTLHILNCCLDPLLYTFLSQTLKFWVKVKQFYREIFCFCCSGADIEDYERANPFIVDNYEKRESRVKFDKEVRY